MKETAVCIEDPKEEGTPVKSNQAHNISRRTIVANLLNEMKETMQYSVLWPNPSHHRSSRIKF